MRRGRHYATFTLRTLGGTMLGVVGAGFDPTTGAEAYGSAQGWLLDATHGILAHAGCPSRWEGQPQRNSLKEGDVVVWAPVHPAPSTVRRLTALSVVQGLLLDLDAATLTVWVNGERKGVMVRPGMTNQHGEPVGPLEGSLRWAQTCLGVGASTAIAGPLPLPDCDLS